MSDALCGECGHAKGVHSCLKGMCWALDGAGGVYCECPEFRTTPRVRVPSAEEKHPVARPAEPTKERWPGELELLRAENPRLAQEHTQVHAWNDRLFGALTKVRRIAQGGVGTAPAWDEVIAIIDELRALIREHGK